MQQFDRSICSVLNLLHVFAILHPQLTAEVIKYHFAPRLETTSRRCRRHQHHGTVEGSVKGVY